MSNTDFPLNDWRAAGLNVPSGVKSQLATVEKRLVLSAIGQLAARDVLELDTRLRIWLKL